jgi:ribosomal 50S subunit-recycling heat shock protein
VFDGRRLTVNDELVKPSYILSASDVIKLLVHMHEPEVSSELFF